MNLLMLALTALAASRVVHLIGDDIFPVGALRDRLYHSQNAFAAWLGHGLRCTFCLSVHAGFWAAWLALGMGWASQEAAGLHNGGWLGAVLFFCVLWWAFAQAIVLIEGTVFKIMGD